MTQAVVTRRDGDVFQARLFWLHAARLLDDEGPIVRVGFESGLKGFDDIWVEYDPARAPQDHRGNALLLERMQCKWHAAPGTFTHEDLTRPEYINATTTSLLQRALAAYREDKAEGRSSRLVLVTNHFAREQDPLFGLLRMKSLHMDVDGLFVGKTVRSATGKVRKVWQDHLGIDEDELRALCLRMGFKLSRDSLDGLRGLLDDACRANGLVRPAANASTTVYDANIFEWVGQRRMVFDRKEFKEKCAQEGLLAVKPSNAPKMFGVKTFEHTLDRLENRCVKVLNLVHEFDERTIRNTAAWRDTMVPRLTDFLLKVPAPEGRMRLAIEAHATLAFAAGAILDTKSGRQVELEQRSPVLKIWAPDDQQLAEDSPGWVFEEEELDANASGTACAVSITRDATAAVKQYLQENQVKVRLLLIAKPSCGASPQAVSSGAHANALAEKLAEKLKRDRDASPAARRERIHLFVSAPNAFTFYLGRQVAMMKPLTLYEYDFTYQVDGSYRPSLSYPEVAAAPKPSIDPER
ncbi:SAVED domain-containing protein [Roseateles cavernae]|uniref:SAVED domain-containing protein n=1 Tax=Roseateles cavernae TaxID=3153578 RepID=UPI0032E3F441